MKNLHFNSDQCVEIVNYDQFNEVKHVLRNPAMNMRCPFPVYFERANSGTRGSSIGIILEPVGTWSNQPLEIISFNEAIE